MLLEGGVGAADLMDVLPLNASQNIWTIKGWGGFFSDSAKTELGVIFLWK
jgi:hypothetical protein